MKYSAVLLCAVGAFAIPQDASVTSAPASPPVASGLPGPVSCALACAAGDVTCQASCLGNARPNASQAIATNECAAKCDQGDGSTPAAQAYAKCVDACINSLFPSSQTADIPGAPAAASGAASSGGAASATPAHASGHSSASAGATAASGSGSGASPKSTGAADKNSVRIAGAGLAGLMAVFAL